MFLKKSTLLTPTASPHLFRRTTCRLCDASELELVLKLTPTPAADAYLHEKKNQEAYPMDLYLCRECGHAQLLDVVDPAVSFGDYIYVTSSSPGLVEHFRRYASDVMRHLDMPKNSSVLDIGSNDGTLLKFFKEHGMNIIGVDPARAIAEEATQNGLPTLVSFFTSDLARNLLRERGPMKLICANNAFAHSDDLADITDGVQCLLDQNGVFVFEASYLLDTIEGMVFDFICNEHLSYHSVKPLQRFLSKHGLELFDIVRIPTHGGSIRGFAQHAGGPRPVSTSVEAITNYETKMGLDRLDIFKRYASQIEKGRIEVVKALKHLSKQGKVIAGYGASPTTTVLIYHFDLGHVLSFIVDDNQIKHNTFSPGHHIPVLSSEVINERKPDYIVILAWRFAEMIMKRHAHYRAAGGKFIVPLPELKFV